MTGVQTGCDSRLCAGAALVIRGQTFGFGGHAAFDLTRACDVEGDPEIRTL
jgi:hypothetical protein